MVVEPRFWIVPFNVTPVPDTCANEALVSALGPNVVIAASLAGNFFTIKLLMFKNSQNSYNLGNI